MVTDLHAASTKAQILTPASQFMVAAVYRACGASANPPQHVGGEVFTVNKLVVLSPYLGLIVVVVVAAFAFKRRKN